MLKYKILWVDDEIDLLKAHVLFLTDRGYDVTTVNNGHDAIDLLAEQSFDIVFLDENMPGISGLETLTRLKANTPNIPVVMITKSEEEYLMDEAIGSKIADYLIKPLNPNQILLSVKKILDNQRIVTEKTNISYQQEFAKLSMEMNDELDHEGWAEVYRKLVYWEIQLDSTEDKSMSEVLQMQKSEADNKFSAFIEENYASWFAGKNDDKPLMSHEVLRERVFPYLEDEPVVLIVIDNLRLDQWETIEEEVSRLFDISSKEHYYSILPTTTAYARNALFAGQMPLDIVREHPDLWIGEDQDTSRNKFERELLQFNLEREKLDIKAGYHKIIHAKDGRNLLSDIDSVLTNRMVAIVYNFVDMLSHARTDVAMIRELAPDESAYRALTKTWFTHSSLYDTLRSLSEKKVRVVVTTDHGTIRVKRPEKIVGDRATNTNLRFKQGRNLAFDEKGVYFTREPEQIGLPKLNVSTTYAFAREDSFFAYPNNYNYYVNHFKDTFQHGGISLEEVIVPLITLRGK